VVIAGGLFASTAFAYTYFIAFFSVFIVLGAVYKFKWKRRLDLRTAFVVLNTITLVIIVLSLYTLANLFKTVPSAYYTETFNTVYGKKFVTLKPNSNQTPDIYYIILDSYGRQDILQQFYGYNNTEFIASLEEMGFIIPEHGQSNYSKTVLSISSMLNMDYVQNFVPNLDSSDLWWLMSPWLDHNLVRTSLERIGYSSVSTSTNWSITDNPTTDYYFKSHPIILTDMEMLLVEETPLYSLKPLFQDIATVPTYSSHRRSQLNSFKSLIKITELPGPKLVYAHILLPHPPFVFASDGSEVDPSYSYSLNDENGYPGEFEQYPELYVGQTQFLNSQLEPVIDAILNNSKTPPIIILQADHGPGMLTDSGSAARSCLRERFSPFSAYYLPGIDPEKIPDDITPVNLYRIIFNEYFDANLPLLQNFQYFPGHGSIYKLEVINPEIDANENCSLE
jgi:hypothetical protein